MAGEEVAFTAGADMEFVIGQYTQGFEDAFNFLMERGHLGLFWSHLGWGDEQAPQLLAALEYVRDHYPEGAKKMRISIFDGNNFSRNTKMKIKKVCQKFFHLLLLLMPPFPRLDGARGPWGPSHVLVARTGSSRRI